jgi:hypothetical protein
MNMTSLFGQLMCKIRIALSTRHLFENYAELLFKYMLNHLNL